MQNVICMCFKEVSEYVFLTINDAHSSCFGLKVFGPLIDIYQYMRSYSILNILSIH